MRKSTNIMYCSYGSRPTVIDFDGGVKWFYCLPTLKKKEKEKEFIILYGHLSFTL